MPEEIDKLDTVKEQERTTEKKAEFIKEYPGLLGVVTATCQKIGIDRQTYYNWIDDDLIFKETIKKLGARQYGDVEDRLLKAINDGNIAAIIFYLKSKHPEYKPKMDVNTTFNQKELDKEAQKMRDIIDGKKNE